MSLMVNGQVASNRILYTPSDFARANLLHLQEVGSLRAIRPHVSSRADMDSFLFFIVKKGRGELVYDSVKYVLKAGDCVFINCKKPYSHSSSEDLWELKWCHFYGANMGAVYAKYKERGGLDVLNPGELGSDDESDLLGSFCAILDDLYEIAASDSYVRDMQINLKLTELMTRLMEESWHPLARTLVHASSAARGISRTSGNNMMQVKTYIDANFTKKMSLESLAGIFYVNKSYLARTFKEQFGVSVVTYIRLVRVGKAKELLRFTDETVENIARDCGVDDPNYFTRMFKSVEGVTPMQFRKEWR